MGLMDSLRRAEEEGKALARRSVEKARTAVDDAERTMRRSMRVHPRRNPLSTAGPSKSDSETSDPAAGGIVSIHGRDINPDELDKNAA